MNSKGDGREGRKHRLGHSTELEDRSSGALFRNAIRKLREKSHGHVEDAEAEGIEVTRL